MEPQYDGCISHGHLQGFANPLKRDLRAAGKLSAAQSRGNGCCEIDGMLLPMLLPGVARVLDVLSGLAERGEHAGELLIELSPQRRLSGLNSRLPAFFRGLGLDLIGLVARF